MAAATGERTPEGRGSLADALPWAGAVTGLLLLLGIPVWAFSGLVRAGRGEDDHDPPREEQREGRPLRSAA